MKVEYMADVVEYWRVNIDIDHLHDNNVFFALRVMLCLNVQIIHNLIKYVLICIQNQNQKSFIVTQTRTVLYQSSQRTVILQKNNNNSKK